MINHTMFARLSISLLLIFLSQTTISDEVLATRYVLTTGKLTTDLWYSDSLGWVGLPSNAGKGRRLVYRRMQTD